HDVPAIDELRRADVRLTNDRACRCRERWEVHLVGAGDEDDDVRVADARAVRLMTIDDDRLRRRWRAQRDGDAVAFAAGAHVTAGKAEVDVVTARSEE